MSWKTQINFKNKLLKTECGVAREGEVPGGYTYRGVHRKDWEDSSESLPYGAGRRRKQ